MSEANSGGERSSRRPKRFLSPSQKYEIWLQLVRQEVTIAEAAAEHQVDRTTIMRIRTVAKEGALAALAASKPGTAERQRDYELEAAKAENARLSEALKEMAVRLEPSPVLCALPLLGRMARCRASTTRTPRPGRCGWSASTAMITTRSGRR